MGRNTSYLTDIKTALKAKVRARPKVKGSEYLDLFVMDKYRARLEQERYVFGKRNNQIDEDLNEIQETMETVQKALSERGRRNKKEDEIEKRPPKKKLKKMTIDY